MLSGKDIVAFALAATVMLGPLLAATYGARHADPKTVQQSGAVAPGQTQPPDQK